MARDVPLVDLAFDAAKALPNRARYQGSFMQFDDVILGRRSIRGYKPIPCPGR